MYIVCHIWDIILEVFKVHIYLKKCYNNINIIESILLILINTF